MKRKVDDVTQSRLDGKKGKRHVHVFTTIMKQSRLIKECKCGLILVARVY